MGGKGSGAAGRPRERTPGGPPGLQEWIERCPIRKFRKVLGLTQPAVSTMARISDVTVRALETGRRQEAEELPALDSLVAALNREAKRQGKETDEELFERYVRWLKRGPNLEKAA